MEAIDKAIVAQNWLMQYYRQWIPLDSCLALIHSIDDAAQQKDALDNASLSAPDDTTGAFDDSIIGALP